MTTPIPMRHITLGDLIETFSAMPANTILPIGLRDPHSYRGDYTDLAFEIGYDIRISDMVDMLRSCDGRTFTGYKGGDYVMDKGSWCFISEYGDSAGDRIGPVLLHFLSTQIAIPHAA